GVECSVYHDKKRQQSVVGLPGHIIRSYLHSCHVGHESFCCHLGGSVPPGPLPPLVTHTIWSRPFQRLRVFGILGRHHRTQGGSRMPTASPAVYTETLRRAKSEGFAYPAINVTSSQTLPAALRGFAEAESDGIIQISTGGAEFLSGATIKAMVAGSVAF